MKPRQKDPTRPTRKLKYQTLATTLVVAVAALASVLGWWDPSAAEIETWAMLVAAVLALPPVTGFLASPDARDEVVT